MHEGGRLDSSALMRFFLGGVMGLPLEGSCLLDKTCDGCHDSSKRGHHCAD